MGGLDFDEEETTEWLGYIPDYWRAFLLGAVAKFYGAMVIRMVKDRTRAAIKGTPSQIRDTKIAYARVVHSITSGARGDTNAQRLFGNILAEELVKKVNRVKVADSYQRAASSQEFIREQFRAMPKGRVAEVEKEEHETELLDILKDERSPYLLGPAQRFAANWLRYFEAKPESHLKMLPPWRPTLEEVFSALGEVASAEANAQEWWVRFSSAWNRIGVTHYRTAPRSRWSLLEMS